MREIKYLVFGGGGAAGCAYAGALEALSKEPAFSFDQIRGVAGSSIGAIVALGVCLRFTSEEVSSKLGTLDLKKFQDDRCVISQAYRLFSHYGIYKGNTIYEFILQILVEKTGRLDPENITFADLKAMGFKDLFVVATKLFKENGSPTGKQKIFSYEKTPLTAVATAILASTSAPIYFSRVRIKKFEKGKYVLDEDGDLYNDGGILNNFPIDIFDEAKYVDLPNISNSKMVNPHTLGLALRKAYQINDQVKPIKTVIADNRPVEFTKGLIASLLHHYEQEKLDETANRLRSVLIDRLGIDLNDFDMDDATKQRLIESGRAAVKAYFAQSETAVSNEAKILPFAGQAFMLAKAWRPVNDSEIANKGLGACVKFEK